MKNNNLVYSNNNSPSFSLKNVSKKILKTNRKFSPVSNSPHQDQLISSLEKTPILIKDKINYSPGYGLWCHNLNENKKYNKKEVERQIYKELNNKSLKDDLVSNIDKRIIEQLRYQVTELITKLENTLGKLSNSEFRAKRAEDLSKNYLDVTNLKVKEHKDMYDMIQSFEDQISNLNEALSMAKKEINRLNNDILKEKENFNTFRTSFENYKFSRDEKEEQLRSENKNLMNQIQTNNNKKDYMGNEENKREEESNNKNRNKNSNIKEIDKNTSQKFLLMTENILKYQLEIVDLKKKITEEEHNKKNLIEIIKKKKEKINLYKTDLTKLIMLFEESSKDKKWKDDLLIRKSNMIKVLKEKMSNIDGQDKQILQNVKKLKTIKTQHSNEVNNEVFFVKANPQLFV